MSNNLSDLHQFLLTHYDKNELRTLCFELGIAYDDLAGRGLSGKTRELILWFGRQHQFDILLACLQKSRSIPFHQKGFNTDTATLTALYQALPAFQATTFQSRLWVHLSRLFTSYWPILLAIVIINIAWTYLFFAGPRLRDRYLVPSYIWLGGIALMAFVTTNWYVLRIRQWRGRWIWLITLGLSLLLIMEIKWLTKQIILPEQFPTETFGIAVARFGEGFDYRGTALALEVTDEVISGLNEIFDKNAGETSVTVKPVGLITSKDEARDWGRRVKADIVVWGQVTRIGEGIVTINFSVIETPDRASNPIFPLILPATTSFIQKQVVVVDAPIEPEDIKRLVSQQSLAIATFTLGLVAYFERDYSIAIEQFKLTAETFYLGASKCDSRSDVTQETNELGLVYFYLGRSYQRLGQLDIGEQCLLQARVFMPEDPAIPLALAYGYYSLGFKDKAERLASDTVDLSTDWLLFHPDDSIVIYDRGLAYQLLDQPLRAALEFDSIIEQDPNFYVAYLNSGLAYLDAGEIDQAISRFQAAIQQAENIKADSSWGYLYLGDAYYAKKEFNRVEESYQRAIELAPDTDWMHYRLGLFYESQGEIKAARKSYAFVIEVAYDKAWAHAIMGDFLRRQSLLDEAIDEYLVVRRDRIFDTLSQIYLAELYLETGQFDLARQVYEEALARTPDLQYGHASYGRALVQLGDYLAAINHLKIALELDPSDERSRFNLGRAYEANDQIPEAIAEYQSILNDDPNLHSEVVLQNAQERVEILSTLLLTPVPSETPSPTLVSPVTSTPNTPTPMETPSPTLVSPVTSTPNTPTSMETPSPTLVSPVTPTPTSTGTPMPTPIRTPSPTSRPATTPTSVASPTLVVPSTPTGTRLLFTPTLIPTPTTGTPTPTWTPSPTLIPPTPPPATSTGTPTPTWTPSPTLIPPTPPPATSTGTPMPTWTPSPTLFVPATPTVTATGTPMPTWTPSPILFVPAMPIVPATGTLTATPGLYGTNKHLRFCRRHLFIKLQKPI